MMSGGEKASPNGPMWRKPVRCFADTINRMFRRIWGFTICVCRKSREAQAELARNAGVEGFCYWHYWFAGKRLLERPFNEVLRSGQPRFPLLPGVGQRDLDRYLAWRPDRALIEQTYPGRSDNENHFHALLKAFHDPRYIRVRGKPVFVIYCPTKLPRPADFVEHWQTLALKNGLEGIHFVAHVSSRGPFDYLANGFAGVIPSNTLRVSGMSSWQRSVRWHQSWNGYKSGKHFAFLSAQVFAKAVYLKLKKHMQPFLSRPQILDYREAMLYFLDNVSSDPNAYPCVVHNWDNSPRSGTRAVVMQNSTPELFRKHLREALTLVAGRVFEDRIVFLKSWNEWAEGNYLEPDLRFGHQYLDVIREEIFKSQHGNWAAVSANDGNCDPATLSKP